MASPAIINTEELLQPISEESPAGSDIRENSSAKSPYYAIKDARGSARAAERNNMFEGTNSEADEHWRKILELAPDILKNHSKDLEIASWYTEALVRRYGFQGLRDGFIVIRGLIEQYWDTLFPLPDEDGIETRVAPLTGLNGEGAEGVLIAPIRNIAITEGQPPGPFSFWKYQQALDIQKITDEEARTEKAGKIGFSLDNIETAVNESSESFFIDQRDDVGTCIEEYRNISRMLDEHCGTHEAPPTSNIINVLQECAGAINHLGKHILPAAETETEAADGDTATAAGGSAQAKGPIGNREAAFKQLRDISEFFRKTEPHSPISYVLEKAVKWGNMPLGELISELIPDSSSRAHYSSLTGVKSDDD